MKNKFATVASWFIFTILDLILIIILTHFCKDKIINNEMWLTFAMTHLFLIIALLLSSTFSKTYQNMILINNRSFFKFQHFNYGLSLNRNLLLFLKEQNVQYAQAIRITFNKITNSNMYVGNKTENSTIKEIANYLYSYFDKETTYFSMIDNRTFLIVIKQNLPQMINKDITNHINNLNFSEWKKVFVPETIVMSYGTEFNDINHLINKIESYFTKTFNNRLFYNYNSELISIKQNELFINFLNEVKPPKIDVKLSTSVYKNNKIFYPEYVINSTIKVNQNFLINKLSHSNQIMYKRYLAALAIKKYSLNKQITEHPLMIDYPMEWISSNDFNINNFISKLDLLNIDCKKLILQIKVNHNSELNTFIANSKQIKQNNIKIKLI
ncbi:MAG: hypothetical protein LBL60_01515 [Mycoplasmataceae bacterium]|nr:hypothetical protein [Mycoplasmataceae bacterium]